MKLYERLQQRQVLINPTAARAELARRRFYYFFLEFWETIEAVELVPNWHIEYICDRLQECYEAWERGESQPDILINVPPGSSKSTMVTQLFPAWLWTRNRTIRIISSSYSGDLSTAHAVKTRDCLQSDKYRLYYPGWIEFKRDQAGKTHYKNTMHGERFITSTGGRVTGMHGDFIIIDDPIDPQSADAQSGRELENASRFVSRTLSTRKVNKKRTVTIMVMQRLHEKDPAGVWIKKKRSLNHICLPGKISKDVRPAELSQMYVDRNGLLDSNRLDYEALDKLQEDLGSYGFAGQIQQTPSPEDGGIWKGVWFRVIPDKDFPEPSRMQSYGTDWDTAYTESEKNDASAYLTSGKIGNDQYIDKLGFAKKEFPQLIAYMREQAAPHYIEAKASGKSAKQALKAMGIVAIEVSVPGGDKPSRARLASPRAEGGFVFIRASLLEMLLHHEEQGILKFPNGAHDDVNDVLVQSINRHFSPALQAAAY